MSATVAAPRQFKQPSRKGKKAWRKNVDITQLQEGLEEVRDEVIKGGIIAEKPSSALFTLDTTGSKAIQKAYHKVHKPLKADEILAQRSAIPAVDSRKRPGSYVTDGVTEPSSKKPKRGGVSHKELMRLKKLAYGGGAVHKDVVKADGEVSHDPWAENLPESAERDPQFSFLEPPKPKREPKTLKRAPISLVASGKDAPAVKKPEAGFSYNPSFQDWDEILTREGQKEVVAERKKLQEEQKEKEKQERVAASALEQDQEVDSGEESVWEGIETEAEADEEGPVTKKQPERKTPAQRNKIKKRKEAERQARWDAQMKKRARQAEQIKMIAKAVEAREKAKSDIEGDSLEEEDIDDRVLRRRKLGRIPVPEQPLELVLPEELRESLRLLKPEGNLLKDRYRSMLVRGRVESRRPITQPKKARRAYTEKWTYKDFKI